MTYRVSGMKAAAAIIFLLAGCGYEDNRENTNAGTRDIKAQTDKTAATGAEKDYPHLPREAILIKIGTNEIRKADIEKLVDLRSKTIRANLSGEEKKFTINRGTIWTGIVASLPETYKLETALLEWAEEKHIKPEAKDIEECRNGFLAGCKAQGKDFNDFMTANFSDEERMTAEARIRIEATCAKAQKRFLEEHPVKVPQNEMESFLKRVADYNDMAAKTNTLVWAKATNLWKRVRSGEDFKMLAEEFSENESERDEGGAWGTYSLGDLEKEGESELAQALSQLGPGDATAPVESDNGLAIVRIDEINDAHGEPLTEGARPFSANYSLSRIYLKLALQYEIPPKEESEKEIVAYKKLEAVREFAAGLASKKTVEYPSGEYLFENARERMRMPQIAVQESPAPAKTNNARIGERQGK